MKHKGSSCEFAHERNVDLMRAYRHLIATCNVIVTNNIYKQVVEMPSSRFWVSEERAAIVISSMYRGDKLTNMRPTTREMYKEIFARVEAIRNKYPDKSLSYIIFDVVRQPAPKFYLTPDSARVIVSRIKCSNQKKDWLPKSLQLLQSSSSSQA